MDKPSYPVSDIVRDAIEQLRAIHRDGDPRRDDDQLRAIALSLTDAAISAGDDPDALLGSIAIALAWEGQESPPEPAMLGRLIRHLQIAADARKERSNETAHERHLLAKLQPISRAVSSDQSVALRLESIARIVAEAMDADACTIFLHDEATHVLALRAAWGMDPATVSAVTLRVGSGIAGQAALEQRTIIATHAQAHSNYLKHPGLGDELFTSQVSAPMVVNGQQRLVGVLSIHAIETRQISVHELEFLESVASLLAVTIDNDRHASQTDEELQRKITELATLQRVSRMVASTLDLSEVLKLITEQAVELINAEAAAIFRLSPEQTASRTPQPTIEYRVGRMRSHENESSRDAVVRDVLQSGIARTRDISYEDGMSSVFCLPLNTARETVGALCFRMSHGKVLDEEELGLLQAFGDAAAIAIDNARLYQEAIKSVQTQSALVQEMHHRVRNNLQTVAALLSLQLRSEEDAAWTHELREAISRIQAIAAVHDIMSDESRLAGTTVDVIARMVAEDAHSTLIPPGLHITFDIPKSTLMVPSHQATIIALLINELASNAIHHGFAGRHHGHVRIVAREEAGTAEIEVFNDGARIPKGFAPEESNGLGMRITQRLVTSDLRGRFTIEPTDDGTLATIRFPVHAPDRDEQEALDYPAGRTDF